MPQNRKKFKGKLIASNIIIFILKGTNKVCSGAGEGGGGIAKF